MSDEIEHDKPDAITRLRAENDRLKAELHTASDMNAVYEGRLQEKEADNERLKIENIQMQAALGYGILAEDERHILPSNPFKCGTCDASKHLRADNERLRQVLENTQQARVLQGKAITDASNEIERLRAALEEVMEWSKPHDRVNIIARAVLEEGK